MEMTARTYIAYATRGYTLIFTRFLIVLVAIGLASGCSRHTDVTPQTIASDIGTYVENEVMPGEFMDDAAQIWTEAESHLEGAFGDAETVVEATLGDAVGFVDKVTARADTTVEHSMAGSRIGLETGYREGSLAGALAGGVTGLAGGAWLVQEHAAFHASQEVLNDEIATARELTESSALGVEAAREALDAHRREIGRLDRAYEEGLVSARTYEETFNAIAEDGRTVQSMISTANERIAVLDERVTSWRDAGYDASALDEASAAQKRDIANLREIEGALIALVNGAPDGISRPEIRSMTPADGSITESEG